MISPLQNDNSSSSSPSQSYNAWTRFGNGSGPAGGGGAASVGGDTCVGASTEARGGGGGVATWTGVFVVFDS